MSELCIQNIPASNPWMPNGGQSQWFEESTRQQYANEPDFLFPSNPEKQITEQAESHQERNATEELGIWRIFSVYRSYLGQAATESRFQGENPQDEEMIRLSLNERSQRLQELTERNQAWLERKCEELRAGWIMVVDGRVITHGSTLQDFPDDQHVETVAEQTGKFPLIFIHPSLLAIEETSAWLATTVSGDSYPSLPITFENHTLSLSVIADFDTGSYGTFADWDRLENEGIIVRGLRDVFRSNSHLGHPYTYLVKSITVTLIANGAVRRGIYTIACVQNWSSSPFVRVNPQRQALAGRNICLQLQPIVELNFRDRLTRLRWPNEIPKQSQ